MIDSRNINDLHPIVKEKVEKFLDELKIAGYNVIVTCTYRDIEAQDFLYAQGRTKPGGKVTNARGGFSYHNYRLAVDIVPMRYGKPVWGTNGDDLALWKRIGAIGKECGLEWAGDWERFKEFPHFQYTGNLTIGELRAGKKITA